MSLQAPPHPEFEMSLDAQVADAVLRLLRSDLALSSYAKGNIDGYELESFFEEATNSPPCVGVILGGTLRERRGSNRVAMLSTQIAVAFLVPSSDNRGTDNWLRSRLVSHVTRLFEATDGVLYADDGTTPLTEALLTLERVTPGRRTPAGSVLFLTLATFRSQYRNPTEEFIQ